MIPTVALHIAQVQETESEAPALMGLREVKKPIRYHRVLAIEFRLVAITGLTDTKCHAGQRPFAPSLCAEAALQLSLEGFLAQLRFDALFCVHLLDPRILCAQFLHLFHK